MSQKYSNLTCRNKKFLFILYHCRLYFDRYYPSGDAFASGSDDATVRIDFFMLHLTGEAGFWCAACC